MVKRIDKKFVDEFELYWNVEGVRVMPAFIIPIVNKQVGSSVAIKIIRQKETGYEMIYNHLLKLYGKKYKGRGKLFER